MKVFGGIMKTGIKDKLNFVKGIFLICGSVILGISIATLLLGMFIVHVFTPVARYLGLG